MGRPQFDLVDFTNSLLASLHDISKKGGNNEKDCPMVFEKRPHIGRQAHYHELDTDNGLASVPPQAPAYSESKAQPGGYYMMTDKPLTAHYTQYRNNKGILRIHDCHGIVIDTIEVQSMVIEMCHAEIPTINPEPTKEEEL